MNSFRFPIARAAFLTAVCFLLISTAAQQAVAQADDDASAKKPAASKVAAEKPTPPSAEKKAAAKKTTPAKPKRYTIVRLTIDGTYPEGPTGFGLLGEIQKSLSDTIERIDAAAEDKAVDALWLQIEAATIGRGKLNEFRAAIGRFRKTGKPVYAELASADGTQYLLASACDQVVMAPGGMLLLPGVRAEVTFYKGLLDKLGIQFDMLQMGKYKGAAEPYTRSEMSPPLRESMEALVDDTYEWMVEMIAADRGMKDYQVKTILDEGIFTATSARRNGLIDEILYADQFAESLKKRLKVDQLAVVKKYKKDSLDQDLSGMAGMLKLFELFVGKKAPVSVTAKKKIAVVYAVGPIMQGKSATDLFGDTTVGSTTLVEALKEANKDDKIAAVVLRIDSPGGSAVASDLIWRETVRIEKPLIASMGDVAGSGGYYIAMGADQIFAAPGTITGSIGVVGGKIVLGGLYDKVGVTTEVISRGAKSGLFSSTQPFSPEERKALNTLLNETYRQFVGKAAQGRQVEYAELEKLAQGRVYTGRMAKELGLIDQLGTLKDAVAAAKEAAGIDAAEEVELIVLPQPKTLFEQLFGDASVSAGLQEAAPQLTEAARKTGLIRRLFTEPTLMWMPYEVKVK